MKLRKTSLAFGAIVSALAGATALDKASAQRPFVTPADDPFFLDLGTHQRDPRPDGLYELWRGARAAPQMQGRTNGALRGTRPPGMRSPGGMRGRR
jgi:hypothetical protein